MAKTKKEKFKAEVMLGHKGAAVEVPFDPEKQWGIAARPLWPGRRGHTVRGELNGVIFGSCIVPRSRKFWMLVDEEVQQKAGVSVGDTVRITVEPLEDRDRRGSMLIRRSVFDCGSRPRGDALSKPRSQAKARKAQSVTFDTVRELALALPGVEEGTSYGTPSFRVGGKILARFHQDGESLVLKVEYAAREVLMGTHPETFYVTDHYRCYPWMLVRLSKVDPGLLRGLIEHAWSNLAPKRAIAAREASRD